MKYSQIVHLPILLCMGLLLLSACGTVVPLQVKPDYMADSFHPESIGKILVLPPFDIRKDRSSKIDFHGPVNMALIKWLPEMGYRLSFKREYGDLSGIGQDEIADMKPQLIRKLAGPDYKWIFLVAIEDLAQDKETFGSAFAANSRSYLIDVSDGKVLWRDSKAGYSGASGLVGMMVSNLTAFFSTHRSVCKTLFTLPPRNGKKWYLNKIDDNDDCKDALECGVVLLK